jgi:hypothetical protein
LEAVLADVCRSTTESTDAQAIAELFQNPGPPKAAPVTSR